MGELTLHSPNEAFSLELGLRIGKRLLPGDILALWGELGAGKTLLTRGIAQGLGIPPDVPITSPTFTFMNEYDGRLRLYHMDLYRLADVDELESLPWREALFGDGAAVMEWPERLEDQLPSERWDIRISITGEESREIVIAAHGDGPLRRIGEWASALTP
ncbi:MAG: tRNA (adenosine(37)-N6)-threonylcarbamoyltransferase complex ATPase subunit type 1 TsaE [Syntrophobacteraceae bacterium]